jgi:hypothetical protein
MPNPDNLDNAIFEVKQTLSKCRDPQERLNLEATLERLELEQNLAIFEANQGLL